MLPQTTLLRKTLAHRAGPFLLTTLLLTSQAQATDPLTLNGVAPNARNPGEVSLLSGNGLGQSPEDLFAWVDTGVSGFALEILRAADTEAEARLGAVAAAATGSLHLWKGSTYHLADRTRLSQGRLVSAANTLLFVASEQAGGPTFSALSATAKTLASTLAAGRLRLDLDPTEPPPCPEHRIRVAVIIETGGEPGGTSGGGGNLQGPASRTFDSFPAPADTLASPAWAATLEIVLDAPMAQRTQLAAAAAEILQAQLGEIGVVATAEGTELVLSHALGIQAGFITFSY